MPNPSRRRFTVLACALVGAASLAQATPSSVTLMHVHGLVYSADGRQLMIPSHHGLAVYAGGRWSMAPGPAHDYMGFAGTREALYSSGHPAPGSGLVNPFGLIKSTDGGRTWRKLGLEGESDFHLLAAGHGTNAVYVVNPAPNSRMPRAGIHFTLDDGKTWTAAAAKGVDGPIGTLAVHPGDAKTVAVGTTSGLYLSRDAAARFERLVGGRRVLAAHFDLDGRHLWFGSFDGRSAALSRIELAAGAQPQPVTLPPMAEDAVAYIAQNPLRRGEIAVATFRRSVFLSVDQGRSWKRIAAEGQAIDG